MSENTKDVEVAQEDIIHIANEIIGGLNSVANGVASEIDIGEHLTLYFSHTILSKALFCVIYKVRHNTKLLAHVIAMSNLPWSEKHGSLLTKTKLKYVVPRYAHIPYSQKDVRKLLRKAVLMPDEMAIGYSDTGYLAARLVGITFTDLKELLFLDNNGSLSHAMIMHHIQLCTPKMINSHVQYLAAMEPSNFSHTAISDVLGMLPCGVLTEDTILKLYSIRIMGDTEMLHFKLAKILPACRSLSVVETANKGSDLDASLAIAAYCVNLNKKEIISLLKLGTKYSSVFDCLGRNQYINWDEALCTAALDALDKFPSEYNTMLDIFNTNKKGLCAGILKKINSAGTKPANVASAASPVASTTLPTIVNTVNIVSGTFTAVDSGNKHWEKRVADAVKDGQKVIAYSSQFGDIETNIVAGIATMQDTLNAEYPNFKPVTQLLMGQLFSCIMRKVPIRFQPLMLLGEPGIGKTSYSQHLSSILGLSFNRVDMAGVTAGFTIAGLNQSWHSGTPGLIAKAILGDNAVANPLFILDEVDKAGGDKRYDVSTTLLSLLEEQTARIFQDEFLDGVKLDLTYSTFFMTANRIDHMSDALLSRMLVIDVEQPTMAEKRSIVQRVYTKKLDTQNLIQKFSPVLEEDMVLALCGDSLRTMDRDLTLSISNALLRAGRAGYNSGIIVQMDDLHSNTKKTGIGFR